jgi:HEPN domain-containing protein
MPHIDEVRVLRKRALAFQRRARESFNSGDYDLAAFLSEQAVQLYLKSILLEELGDYPRTHSISYLFSLISKIQKYKDMGKFFEERKKIFRLMEDSYISSRYLSREFTKEEAEELLNAAEEVLKWRNT